MTVRDREAAGSNPGPPTSFLSSRPGSCDPDDGDFGSGGYMVGAGTQDAFECALPSFLFRECVTQLHTGC